jgi:UDP-N-acetyl-D-glucosamine dehydrogenase
VGLPLAILAGLKGHNVLGIDLDKKKVDSLESGNSYISGIADHELQELTAAGKLRVRSDYSQLPDCDVVVVCVPTPLTKGKRPDYSNLETAVSNLAPVLRRGQLVIVESTVAPGTTASTVRPILETTAQKAGIDFFLAYSPERIDPGNKTFKLANTPKLAAGLTPMCQFFAQTFYESLGVTVKTVRTLAIAELAKLLENTYRDINIAFINEMAQVCHSSGIDIWDVIDAAATKPFGFLAFYPGPGVGGHCIPIDSVYYSFWARKNGVPAKLAEHARRINEGMPRYAARLISDVLHSEGKSIKGCKILIMGVTYKKDTSDIRESPAVELIRILKAEGADVNFHDPSIGKLRVDTKILCSVSLEETTVSEQDCVVLTVAHSDYDLSWLYKVSPLIVDLTNGMSGYPSDKVKKL